MTPYKTLCVAFLVTILSACATSEKIDVVQAGDDNLSCGQIREELAKTDKAQEEVDEKRGFNGLNVISALFWVPGLIYTFYDAGQAEELINKRKANLTDIDNQKNCH